MKNKLIFVSMLIAMTMFWMPAENSVSAQRKQDVDRSYGRDVRSDRQRQVWQGNHKRKGPKWNQGYRNYGQYRRTQVGNRRYRTVRQTYWTNGRRVYRNVRVYY